MNLSDKALLVQLNISQWSARRLDKKATKQVAESNGADGAVGNYNKCLLPANNALDLIHKKTSMIRKKFYTNTLPWGMEGIQILPNNNYFEFMTEFRKEKNEWEKLVNDFLIHYPTAKDTAKKHLGSLFSEDDYPPIDHLRNKFGMSLSVMPVPNADFRTQLASNEVEKIQRQVEDQLKAAQQTAMKELWTRLYDKVKHMADKLSDESAIFKNTLVENIREQTMMLTRMNFSDDQDIKNIRDEVEKLLIAYEPDTLRFDPAVRRTVAADARAISDKMAVFMGGL
jgi:hypothetical protein